MDRTLDFLNYSCIIIYLQTNLTLEIAEHNKKIWKQYFKDAVPEMYKDESIKRQIEFLHILGTSALDQDKLSQVNMNMFTDSSLLLYVMN